MSDFTPKARVIYDDDTVVGPIEALDPTGGEEGMVPRIGEDGKAHWVDPAEGGTVAPSDSEFIVSTSDPELPNARVLTDTANIVKDDSVDNQLSLDLTDTGITPGTYGSATKVAVVTFDEKGRAVDVEEVDITPSGGGGARTKTTIITAALASGGQEVGSFTLAKSSVLIRARSIFFRQCRIRIYGTAAARDADQSRPPEETALAGSGTTGTGIACDLILSSNEDYDLKLDPKAVLANPEDPSITTLYYTADNLTTGIVPVGVELHHVPIEA
jgi:hypothetical protein